MNTNFERITLTVSEHLLSAFINGDESGLDQGDVDSISEFLAGYKQCHAICPDDLDVSFERCEITGMMSNCVELDFDVVNGGAQ